jgi:hypothetical protein
MRFALLRSASASYVNPEWRSVASLRFPLGPLKLNGYRSKSLWANLPVELMTLHDLEPSLTEELRQQHQDIRDQESTADLFHCR